MVRQEYGPRRFRPGRFEIAPRGLQDERGMWHWPDEEPSHRGKGPKGFKRMDERIREEVCELLTFSHEVDASDFEVHVSEGIVTLEGHVKSREEKREAMELAEDVPGVEAVHNHLTIDRSVDGWVPRRAKLEGNPQRWRGVH